MTLERSKMYRISQLALLSGALAVAGFAPVQAAPPAKAPPLAAYVHVVTAANVCASDPSSTVLDHPLANGNPNAVIVATWNTNKMYAIATPGILTASYDDVGICGGPGSMNRWVVRNTNASQSSFLATGVERLNIFVAAPN